MSISDGKSVSVSSAKTPDQLEKSTGGVVSRWVSEISLASRTEKDWRQECDGIWMLYKGGGEAGTAVGGNHRAAFNILWSNTETMRPAVFNSVPKPDVRRRYRDEDKLGKAVSDVIERALEFSADTGHLFDSIKLASLDVCLPGRGAVRVRYEVLCAPIDDPNNIEETDDDAEGVQEQQAGGAVKHRDGDADGDSDEKPQKIVGESVVFEHVVWDDFRRGPGKSWRQVQWVAFRHKMDYDELVELLSLNPEIDDPKFVADMIPLDATNRKTQQSGDKDEETVYQAAEVWEIWDKRRRQVVWVAEGYRSAPLRTDADPLKLREFFPLPRPAYMIEDSTSLVPTPVYRQYKEQAAELEQVTKRIGKIISALKVRGLYHPGIPEVEDVLDAADNEMIPVTNTSTLAQMKSLDDAIWLMPLQDLMNVLQALYTARQQIINVIYQITGISDIMRGDTKASETLGAQELKSKWGTVRLQRVQSEISRFASELIQLAAEVICNRFQLETFKSMTGLNLPMAADIQHAQAVVQQGQQMVQQASQAAAATQPVAPGAPPQGGPQIPPQIMQQIQQAQQFLQSNPIPWETVIQVIRSDMLRQYKVDIESDSTIAETLDSDLMGIQQVLTGVAQFIRAYGPAIQQGYLPLNAAKELIMAIVRRARLGRAVEDAFDQIGQHQQPQNPTEQQVGQLKQMQEGLVKTAKEVGDRHAAQAEQLRTTDATVMQGFQKLQEMSKAVAEYMAQATQDLHSQRAGGNQAIQEIAERVQSIATQNEQFKHAITSAAAERMQVAPAPEPVRSAPASGGVQRPLGDNQRHEKLAGQIRKAHGLGK